MNKTKIILLNNGQLFNYNGEIISQDETFILLNDIKIGEIKLNKAYIISMQEISQ